MKLKVTLTALIDADAKELREELGIEPEDDILEAVENQIKENASLSIDTGDTTIDEVDVKKG